MDELHGCEWTSLRRRATQQLHSTFKLARLTATAAETFGTSVRSTNRSYSHVSAHKANGRVKPAATTQLEHMRLSVRNPPVVENTHTHTAALPLFSCAGWDLLGGAAVHAGLEADSCLQFVEDRRQCLCCSGGRWRRLRLFHRIGFSVTVVKEK